jgi:effector-binding domain-containing protein
MVHSGPFDDIDQTYGALGTIVAERGIGSPGPIREHYLADDRAEVCWPVARPAAP